MKNNIRKGVYLIIDPSIDKTTLLRKLSQALSGDIVAVQIWDNFKAECDVIKLVKDVHYLCKKHNTPLLINNRWEILLETEIEGAHFDKQPGNINLIKKQLRKETIIGITCGNDLSVVKWAELNNLSYLSFCSMFPSTTANSCELVTFNTIKEAQKITSMPIFLAGGITIENIHQITDLNVTGIAVVSGIMQQENPTEALKFYQQKLSKI
jgi:thiamine-phosphate pyrophosphorylase